jgi:hypothetical protein
MKLIRGINGEFHCDKDDRDRTEAECKECDYCMRVIKIGFNDFVRCKYKEENK